MEEDNPLYFKKVMSACCFGMSSFALTFINKTVLTLYSFPSYQFLGLGQMSVTILVLSILKKLGVINYPHLHKSTFLRIWPLPLIYLGNLITGLGGTKELNLPMFTALRRFSIPLTMLGERILLGVQSSWQVKLSVLIMVGGTLLAAVDQLMFSFEGYLLVLISNILTAVNGVMMKKKLDSRDLGSFGLIYYNCLFMFVPAVILAQCTNELSTSILFEYWNEPFFVLQFLMSCFMGLMFTYSLTLCLEFNGALTTTIIGCLKNISITYLGMIVEEDYVFSWINFVGLTISVLGSIFYTYVEFSKKDKTITNIDKECKNNDIEFV